MQPDRAEFLIPARRLIRMCRRNMRRRKLADSTGAELNGAGLLTKALVLRRLLRREVLEDDEQVVGVLIPPTVAAAVVNATLALDGRTTSNLNYSIQSSEVFNATVHQAGIKRILTSRRVMSRLNLEIDAEIVFLEDVAKKISLADKLAGVAQAWLWPVSMLEKHLGLTEIDPDDILTLIFTSGSTGIPKGAMLTHRNIDTNVKSFEEMISFRDEDVMVGILPFFHSFGYTTTMWSAFYLNCQGIYHTSPLEPRPIGTICRKYGGTILVGTPTFFRTYVKKVPAEDFASLNLAVAGAEKLSPGLADAFEEKFGLRPVEGYGTTELSPVVSVNVPADRNGFANEENLMREGSIGKTLPRVYAKVVDLETEEDLGPNETGMLWVRGDAVMKGYYNQSELTADVMRGDWYVTGDVARIDEDGFIFITGRISRFSKIGGEMVPHIRIEETINEIEDVPEDELRLTVTAVPDAKKGERIVVLYTELTKQPQDICREMRERGFSSLWIPSPDSFRQIDEIPVLGSGKVALKDAQEIAKKLFV